EIGLLVALVVDADDEEAVARLHLGQDSGLDDVHHLGLLVGVRPGHVDQRDHRLCVVLVARAAEEERQREKADLLHGRAPCLTGEPARWPPPVASRSIWSGITM